METLLFIDHLLPLEKTIDGYIEMNKETDDKRSNYSRVPSLVLHIVIASGRTVELEYDSSALFIADLDTCFIKTRNKAAWKQLQIKC